jgi:ferritin-like metal-binding protein YciE
MKNDNMKLNTRTLKDLFLDELADMYDAEHRITKALPKMAKVVTCEKLREAINTHLQETEGHITKVEQVFESFEEKAKSRKCKATVGLLEEGDEIASDNKGTPTINAAVISACQKVEHYEIASYGTLKEWASLLGNQEAVKLIQQILDQEKNANTTLSELAQEKNQEALGENTEDEESASSDAARGRGRQAQGTKSGRKYNVLN